MGVKGMHGYRHLAVAVAIVALVTIPTMESAYAATDVLTTGSAGGANVGVGDTLSLSGPASFCSSTSNTSCVKCTMTVSVTVNSNPAAPGTATFSVTGITFKMCTSTIPFLTLRSVAVGGLPYTASVDDASNPGIVTVTGPNGLQVTFGFTFSGLNISCTYAASSISGTAPLGGSGVTFTNQPFNKQSGPGVCFASGLFSATLSAVDVTQGGAIVVLN
jgi:hypothetical protein